MRRAPSENYKASRRPTRAQGCCSRHCRRGCRKRACCRFGLRGRRWMVHPWEPTQPCMAVCCVRGHEWATQQAGSSQCALTATTKVAKGISSPPSRPATALNVRADSSAGRSADRALHWLGRQFATSSLSDGVCGRRASSWVAIDWLSSAAGCPPTHISEEVPKCRPFTPGTPGAVTEGDGFQNHRPSSRFAKCQLCVCAAFARGRCSGSGGPRAGGTSTASRCVWCV